MAKSLRISGSKGISQNRCFFFQNLFLVFVSDLAHVPHHERNGTVAHSTQIHELAPSVSDANIVSQQPALTRLPSDVSADIFRLSALRVQTSADADYLKIPDSVLPNRPMD